MPFLHQLVFISSPWCVRIPVLHSWYVSESKHGRIPAQCIRDPLRFWSRGHAEKYGNTKLTLHHVFRKELSLQ